MLKLLTHIAILPIKTRAHYQLIANNTHKRLSAATSLVVLHGKAMPYELGKIEGTSTKR